MVWESQPQTTIFKRIRDQISGLLLRLKPAFTCHVKYRILVANGAGSGTIQVWKHCMRRPIKYLPNSRTHNMEIHFPCQIIPWRSFNGRLARNQLNQWDQGSWRKCFITTSVFVAASLKKKNILFGPPVGGFEMRITTLAASEHITWCVQTPISICNSKIRSNIIYSNTDASDWLLTRRTLHVQRSSQHNVHVLNYMKISHRKVCCWGKKI